jgi:hypothetical protein
VNHHYADITEKLGDPLWWDEAAVPRYCEFGPEVVANIYAREVALLHIECQACRRRFMVAMSSASHEAALGQQIEADEIHYGDPPNYGCCAAGPTMNSVPRRVIEFWALAHVSFDWKRLPDLERDLECEWAA